MAAFPDLRLDAEYVLESGDRVVPVCGSRGRPGGSCVVPGAPPG